MNIADKLVASFNYTLKNAAGETLDNSEEQGPLAYIHGAGNIVPGLEKELAGKTVGDKLQVIVSAEQGYGEKHEELIQELPKDMFGGIDNIEVGMAFHAQTEAGMQVVEVIKIDGDMVTIDGNHPLAGQELHFDVEITDIREATEEELEHGHVHGVSEPDKAGDDCCSSGTCSNS